MVKEYNPIAVITLIILIIFFVITIILISTSDLIGMKKSDLFCPISYCATSIETGEKLCPKSTEQIKYNAITQVCNKPNSCSNLDGPQYAVQADGSANLINCEEGSICSCKLNPICSRYVLSAFNPDEMITTESENIVIDDNSTCEESTNNLIKCPSASNYVTLDELKFCMSFDNNCVNNYHGSVCPRGILAVIANVNDFEEENIDLYSVACVAGKPCACGKIAVFDIKSDRIVCK